MTTVLLLHEPLSEIGSLPQQASMHDAAVGGVGIVDGWSDTGERISEEQQALRTYFATLADQWYEETGHLSSPSQIAMHPAYQRIIGLGPAAIPLVLDELRIVGGQWFWALRALAGESPVPADSAGKIREAKEAWIRWGRSRGYIR